MQNSAKNVKKQHYLMLCELHHPQLHGKDSHSDPNIENHYLIYDRFDPKTGISFMDLNNVTEYDTDNEYDSDNEEHNENNLVKIHECINILTQHYAAIINTIIDHPTIRNYNHIISRINFFKPEIGEYIMLPTHEEIAILKTFWLRIIQKKWKQIFKQRKEIIRLRCYLSNLRIREINGAWPDSCLKLPELKGMLSELKKR